MIKEQEQALYDEKVARRESKEKETGKKPGGKAPKPPADEPPDNSQFNFTDLER